MSPNRTALRVVAASLTTFMLLGTPVVHGEIERLGYPGERGMVLHWWPKVTAPAGWFRDDKLSLSEGVNMHILEGETFVDSPAVMYTRAFYNDKGVSAKELEQTITDDLAAFRERDAAMKIEELGPTLTADGTRLRTFAFKPAGEGHFELVAYGREPKYVIMFCISARTAKLLDQHRPAFQALVRSYSSKDDGG